MGGALGGLSGFVGAFINGRIFRSSSSTAAKYALTAAASLGTALIFFALAIVLRLLIELAR